MNGSWVIGPAIGSLLYATFGAGWVFQLNALSYLAVIFVLLRLTLPPPPDSGSQGWHRLIGGFTVARHDRVVAQCLIVISTLSLLCLPFITQMPSIADQHLGINPKSGAYGMLYAAFGMGAVIGALLDRHGVRPRRQGPPDPAGDGRVRGAARRVRDVAQRRDCVPSGARGGRDLLRGHHVTFDGAAGEDRRRGARQGHGPWIMGFGGVVPFGGLAGGWLMERTSIGLVVGSGALIAVALAAAFDYRPGPEDAAAAPTPSA